MALFQGRTVTSRVQLLEVDTSSSLAVSLHTKALYLSVPCPEALRDTNMQRKTQLECQGWLHAYITVCWVLFTSSCRHKALYWRDFYALVTSAAFWHSPGTYRTCWQKGWRNRVHQVLRASQTDFSPYMVLKIQFLFIFSKSAVSFLILILPVVWAWIWTYSRFRSILILAGI